jgi:acetate kinase
MEEYKVDARAIENLLYHRSGLLGVSGISSDMRTLLASDDPAAANAVDLFCYRISREIGAVDAIVFIGRIGEHAPPMRNGCAALWHGPASRSTLLRTRVTDRGLARRAARLRHG